MTTKTLTGTYTAGYLLNSKFDLVTITSRGSVGGFGLITNGFAAVSNDGHLLATNGANGLTLGSSGGSLNNQSVGVVEGGQAIGSSGAGAAGRAGGDGVYLTAYGSVANAYLISGGGGGAGIAGAFGGYGGGGGAGAAFHGGQLTNNRGQISGGEGGAAGASSYSTQVRGETGGFGGAGVAMNGYGRVINNGAGVTGGYGGAGGASTGVGGYGGTGGVAVDLANGGAVYVAGGEIRGGQGGHAGYGAGHVAGAGGRGGAGVELSAGGYVGNHSYILGGQGGTGANGETQSYQQLGQGGDGVDVDSGVVENYGVIAGGAGGSAVGGARPGAGGDGVRASGGAVFNYGSVYGGGGGYSRTVKSFAGYGVSMAGVGSITNGSSSVRTAFIEGNGGVSSSGANYNGIGVVAAGDSQVTLTNWGTISGGYDHKAVGGTAVFLGSSADVLVAEAGSVFLGAVFCSGGTLELGAGTGSLSGIDASGNVGVTGFLGSGSNTLFNGFATLEIASGGSFATTATATIAQGMTLTDNGGLTDTGALSVAGMVGGTGSLVVDGALTLQKGSALTVGSVLTGSKSAKVTIASTIVEAGFWDQTQGMLTIDRKSSLTLAGATEYLFEKKTTNSGSLVYEGTGSLFVQTALKNDGQLIVQSGQITLENATVVTGTGDAQIKGGTLAADGVFNQNVFFEGAGTLALGRSQSYTGAISGFSTTGTDFLDLGDIGFVNAGEATFSGNSAGGVLTVSDGTHTAHINLAGNFLSSTFVCASDGHGGVIIHDPAQGAHIPPVAPHALIAAMAALGPASAPAAAHAGGGTWRAGATTLVAPRCAIA